LFVPSIGFFVNGKTMNMLWLLGKAEMREQQNKKKINYFHAN
jgi:hypothetical protein